MGATRESRMSYLLQQVWSDPNASRLKVRRLGQQRDLDQLARAAGVGRATVVRAERGDRVRPETWHKLAAALGVERSEIAPDDIAAPWERTA
jgi:transcriptional regulator with XRE-family HTH domain